jgi:putative molybdopterin biosynthesis protein
MSPSDAWAALAERVTWPDPRPEDEVAVEASLGRVTARALAARVSSPAAPVAAMDGIAVAAAATNGASESHPVVVEAGRTCEVIDTGDPLPAGCDAVIMIEHAAEIAPGRFEIQAPTPPWRNVRLLGDVVRRPMVGLLPTGDELVEPGRETPPGAVVEFNSRVLAAMLSEWGAAPRRFSACPDRQDAIAIAIRRALNECDAVIVNAGSSAGRDDWTAAVLEDLGELVAHGIDVMPGKPTALGVVDGKPVFGLPGYPVSAVVAAERVVQPWVERWLGAHLTRRPRISGLLNRKIASRPGNEEVVRVVAGRVGEAVRAAPLARGAGVISSLSRASGLVSIPAVSEGLDAGAAIEIELLRPIEEIDQAIVVSGSHDLLIDVCADLLRRADPLRSIASSAVGSLAGLIALGRGECHLAGSHLFDPATGTYTLPYVHEYLRGVPVRVVHLAMRRQGLIVRRGNPKGIRTWTDLAREDVTFVNRQRGAGTRVILDVRLRERGIDASQVHGYPREEPTHMAVAAAVAGGVADVAVGIEAAAVRLDLDFVPLEDEPFDLVVAEQHVSHAGVAALLALIRTDDFRQAAARLPGYDPSRSGNEIARMI